MGRPKLDPHERRTARYNLRFTAAEVAHIQQQAEAAGVDVTEYLRRRSLGYVVPGRNAVARGVTPALVSELNRIGVNVNQIARSLNAGRPDRRDLDVVMAELRGVLSRVLDASED